MAQPQKQTRRQPRFQQITVMLLMTAFQLICAACVLCRQETPELSTVYLLIGYIAAEWIYLLIGNLVTGNDYFELEAIAFFLSGLGLTLCASFSEAFAFKQLVAIGLGLAVYLLILLLIKNMYVVRWLRYPAAIGSIGVLALNLLLAQVHNGTLNWIDLGPVSIQPSELVKVVFVFVGAVTLEKLLSTRALWLYIGYALVCVGCLFLMRDFGTALIFFF
ncbi:MAG: FtsW/RodA/SpoVE family cell cycle protein, partial [Clostridia bacterium]|nr:FtsW/RodA/SpoVE family cell cycle protein [Clostridia bacterium]